MGININKRTVSIVLAAVVVVALLFIFLSKFFCFGCAGYVDAIDSIDSESQAILEEELSKKGEWLAVFPESKKISIKKGAELEGFAFGVRNKNSKSNTYSWKVFADSEFDYTEECGDSMNKEIANNYLMLGAGIFRVGSQENNFGNSVLVKFDIPKLAINCTIPYRLNVTDSYNLTKEEIIYVSVEE